MNLISEVKLARSGNKESFEFLIRYHERSLFRIAKAILKNDDDCADAMQETILNVYKSLSNLKHPEYFKTWMVKILINNCNKIIRNNRKVVPIAEYIDTPTDGREFELVELIELTQIINSLQEELRVIVLLYYYEDIAIKDIAIVLNIPEGTVKSRLSRARLKIKEALFRYKWGVNA